MRGDVHESFVLYKNNPKPGHQYRQIVVVEMEQFEVRIYGGDVIQPDPYFSADSQDAEVYFHPSLETALADAKKEFDKNVKSGWLPYGLSS